MTELSEDPDREELREFYENSGEVPDDCHANYGDANPEGHGGNWVTYNPEIGHFELIGTFHASTYFDEYDDEAEAQYVFYNELWLSDIITEDGDFTDSALSTAKSLSGCSEDPAGLIVDGRFTWFVAAMLDEYREPYDHHGDSVREGAYSEILDSLGVEPCESEE
jgi:hypothetical protein